MISISSKWLEKKLITHIHVVPFNSISSIILVQKVERNIFLKLNSSLSIHLPKTGPQKL